MKRLTLIALVLFCSTTIFCQQADLNQINIERQSIDKTGFKVLTAYGLANILYGSIASHSATGSDKYFHKMNAIWNGVTLGIVGVTFLTAKKEGVLSYSNSLLKQNNTEKLFLFNAGLDIAYIAGGAYMKERSKTSTGNSDRLLGYGQSIMLQGSALLLFDGIMYSIHNHHGRKLNKLAGNVQLASTDNGIAVILKL